MSESSTLISPTPKIGFSLPELPGDRLTAETSRLAVETQLDLLLDMLDRTEHPEWLHNLMDRYEAIAHALDAYSHSRSTEQADTIAQRLQRQLIELEEYIDTAPEDLWPRGP
jgi:hypothetical protein